MNNQNKLGFESQQQKDTLVAVCTAYKSSPFLTEERKNELIDREIGKFKI